MSSISSISRVAAWTLFLVTSILAAGYLWIGRRLPEPAMRRPVTPPAEWPSPAELPADETWAVFQKPETGPATAGPLASRYRLAGTFFLYASDDAAADSNRRAIMDDIQKNQQLIVREGDRLDEFEVARVLPDRVLLRAGAVEFELALSFATAPASPGGGAGPATNTAMSLSMEDMPALESSRFGKRVGENRWVFQRDALLNYYREVLDEPERIAAIYTSLKPDYQENEIAGYRLNADGEADFFKAVGLRENDTIRKVNSMRMVSQRRAEYFLSEFLKDRVSALVIDVERDGKPEKLIYLIR